MTIPKTFADWAKWAAITIVCTTVVAAIYAFDALSSGLWKEVAIAIAGVSAILGIISDVREPDTHRLTKWGKVLFVVTIVSSAAALYSQSRENSENTKNNNEVQSKILTLLSQTQRSISELTRIMQPLEKPRVLLSLRLSCKTPLFQKFCASAQKQAEDAYKAGELVSNASAQFRHFDWSDWPDIPPVENGVFINIFRNQKAFDDAKCPPCFGAFQIAQEYLKSSDFRAVLDTRNGIPSAKFLLVLNSTTVYVKDNSVMSVPDLKGAVIEIVVLPEDAFIPLSINIETTRGQNISGDVYQKTVNGETLFVLSLPE
jgi:hypothetical protein